jgi:DNA helicase MCM9
MFYLSILSYLDLFVLRSDDIIVTGRLSAKWSPDIKDVRSNLDPMLVANYVR